MAAGDMGTSGDGFVPLGSFASVRGGVVTGDNSFFVRRPGEVSDLLTVPVVSRSSELMGDPPACHDVSGLSRLLLIPADVDSLPDAERGEAWSLIEEGFMGDVDLGLAARGRGGDFWWAIPRPKVPAVIMTPPTSTLPPRFVANLGRVAQLGVAWGIHLAPGHGAGVAEGLARWLNDHTRDICSAVRAGDPTEYNMRRMERTRVPSPDALAAMA